MYNEGMNKKQFVHAERNYTVELLKKLKPKQWSAKTLCDGWSVEDLAAHLVTRERNIIGGIGLVVPGLQKLHDKRLARVATHGHEYIIEKLQKYPWYMPASLNIAEFWVHNEDFLRGDLKMSRSKPSKDDNEIIWSSLKGLAKVRNSMVKDLGNVTLHNIETREKLQFTSKKSNKKTTISGTAGELLLYFYGRRKAAKVTIN